MCLSEYLSHRDDTGSHTEENCLVSTQSDQYRIPDPFTYGCNALKVIA